MKSNINIDQYRYTPPPPHPPPTFLLFIHLLPFGVATADDLPLPQIPSFHPLVTCPPSLYH